MPTLVFAVVGSNSAMAWLVWVSVLGTDDAVACDRELVDDERRIERPVYRSRKAAAAGA